jgi:DNA-binding SARP family transcriptional activator/CTP:molybdopterin cytidylyltransferase MocA
MHEAGDPVPAAVTDEKDGRRVDARILGLLDLRVDGQSVEIATRRQRALLVLLLLNVGRVVSTERLIDQLWDGTPPPQGAVTLRSYVSNLRQALGATGVLGSALVTRGPGYLIDLPAESVDAIRLRTLTQTGRDLLRQGAVADALTTLDEAVGLWTGDPLAEVSDHQFAQSIVAQLTETYLAAVEGRFEAMLAAGRHADALPALDGFAADHPLREEPQALLMLALYRCGRTPDALEVHRRFRVMLDEELGILPSSRMDSLLQRILSQDPDLAPPAAALEALAPAVATAPSPAAASTETALPAPPAGGSTRMLVGRERELGVLQAALDRLTTSGTGSLVLLAGEPGIGKTTLLETLEEMARRRNVPVHSGRSPAASGAPPFWPWSQVVDSVAARLGDLELEQLVSTRARPVAQLSPAVAGRVGVDVLPPGDTLGAMRFPLYEAVSTYLGRATDGPLVVLLDDIHWADLPSLELLSYLTPSLATRPLLLVAAYRDLPSDTSEALDATLATVFREDVTSEVHLGGLAQGDVAVLAADLLATAAHPERHERFADVLYERTAGNPFFVCQLARLLLEEGPPAATSPAPVPPGVRHVIASRLKPLPAAVTSLLDSAAVIGREFDLRTAATVAGIELEDALDAYDVAAQHGLVEPTEDGGHTFVHALVQEVVLERLPAGRASRLHGAVAQLLEQEGASPPAVVATHTWAARDVLGPAAVESQLAAADAATAVCAHEQAEVHLRRALHLVRQASPPDPDAELSVLLTLLRLIITSRGWGHHGARAVADRALHLAEAGAFNDDNARLWWSLFFLLIDQDDQASYVDVARSLLAACGAPDPHGRIGNASRASVHLMAIFDALSTDDRDAAHRHLTRAGELIEAATAAETSAYDENLHVMYHLIEGAWFGMQGDGDAHQRAVEAAVALADADGRPFPRAVARALGAVQAFYSPGHDYLRELAVPALDLCLRFGFGWLTTVAESVHEWSEALSGGEGTRTVAALQTRLEDMTRGGRNGTRSTMLALLGDVHAALGEPDLARETYLQARQDPGPYRQLFIALLDRRMASLP